MVVEGALLHSHAAADPILLSLIVLCVGHLLLLRQLVSLAAEGETECGAQTAMQMLSSDNETALESQCGMAAIESPTVASVASAVVLLRLPDLSPCTADPTTHTKRPVQGSMCPTSTFTLSTS